MTDGTWHVATLARQGANRWLCSDRFQVHGITNGSTSTCSTHAYILGGNAGEQSPFKGDIADLIVFGNRLSDDARHKDLIQLKWK